MKVIDILTGDRPSLSFEVFPPKTDSKYEDVKDAVNEIAALRPSFMSVTYGAGGGVSEYTTSIAAGITDGFGVPALAHLSCVSSDREMVRGELAKLQERGIENILALRGDILEGETAIAARDYHYASDLIAEIRQFGDFCIGGACYPEGHPESPNSKVDVENLAIKVQAGCQFLTTQMFFDNNIFYNFLYKVRDRGITVPVVAGIMPVTNGKQIARICKLSGTMMPPRFRAIVDHFGDDPAAMEQAGVAFATEQIIDLLANGVNAVHVYSMNKPHVARQIQANLSHIL